MEALGVVASVANVASFCGSVVKYVDRFISEYKTVPDVIRENQGVVHALFSALENLGNALENRPPPMPFERDLCQNIFKIAQSCDTSLHKLQSLLPVFQENGSPMARARVTVDLSRHQSQIQQTISHLTSYTQVINISLNTLALGVSWRNQTSQGQIQAEIRCLTDKIGSLNFVTAADNNPDQDEVPELEDPVASANTAVAREIQDWRLSVDRVASAVSIIIEPSTFLYDTAYSATAPPSDSGISISHDPEREPFDPEQELKDHPGPEIRLNQLEHNRAMVERLISSKVYYRACMYQRKAIQWKKELDEIHGIPFSEAERADMNEYLGDILLWENSRTSRGEGVRILQAELERECKRPAGEIDQHRRARLYHKLGEVYLSTGDRKEAIKFLQRAFLARTTLQPVPSELVRQTGNVLVRALQDDEAFDEACGYKEYMKTQLLDARERNFSISSFTVDVALAWCRERGFNVETKGFLFDVCDSDQRTSPLHIAVQERNVEMVKHMVEHVASFEHCDRDFATPLLLAASTRDHKITQVLIENGARANVRDAHGKTPLHRCQSQKGGLKVASLLLEHQRDLIDDRDDTDRTALFMAVENGHLEMIKLLLAKNADIDIADNYSKTPLYRACERGDEKVVRELLRHNANPNARGPAKSTPLLVTIGTATVPSSSKFAIVGSLIDKAADPYLADEDGKDAFAAAKMCAFSSEIKGLLLQDEERRLSRADSGYSSQPSFTLLRRFTSKIGRNPSLSS